MKTLPFATAGQSLVRSLVIDGKRFELSVSAAPAGDWHWLISAPGEIVLSGGAPSEIQAINSACRAGRALARVIAA
jgi:hypothetical protein